MLTMKGQTEVCQNWKFVLFVKEGASSLTELL